MVKKRVKIIAFICGILALIAAVCILYFVISEKRIADFMLGCSILNGILLAIAMPICIYEMVKKEKTEKK